MASKYIKPVWLSAVIFGLLFLTALAIRYDLIKHLTLASHHLEMNASRTLSEKDSWMNLYLNNQKIGYAHSLLSKKETGYHLDEKIFMRMNIMGFTQDLTMDTSAVLNADLSIGSFDFKLDSGMFNFAAKGQVKENRILSIEINPGGETQKTDIPLARPLYLTSALFYSVSPKTDLSPGDQFAFDIFDPSTMSQEKVTLQVIGDENLMVKGEQVKTIKMMLNYKGSTETAWMDASGDIVREEGILGMTLEKTSEQDAYAGLPSEPKEDITRLASVPTDKIIKSPRNTVYLKIRLGGIKYDNLALNGERQHLDGDILEINQEKITPRLYFALGILPAEARKFLKPEPFIESDNPEIKQIVDSMVSSSDRPVKKVRKIMDWIKKNIAKKPVLSVPDALSTLHNKEGDCNEHAVLMAALSRAAGIPAKIEAGLVYLDGSFYYHAWNLLYVGQWITADSVFGQFPADATHIRFVSGSPNAQLDLMSVVDKVTISIIEDQAYSRRVTTK